MRPWLIAGLAWQDYRNDARLSACSVLALVAVIAPLLVLFGLKFGLVGSLTERLDVIEAMVLRETLLRHRWNKTKAAAELGLSRVGLRAKMQRFGLDKP